MAEARRPTKTDPLEAARDELQRLRAADDWDESTPNRLTPVVHVHAFPPPALERPSPTPPAPLKSVAPRTAFELAGAALKRFPPWGAVLVVIVTVLVYAYLALHGKAPAP